MANSVANVARERVVNSKLDRRNDQIFVSLTDSSGHPIFENYRKIEKMKELAKPLDDKLENVEEKGIIDVQICRSGGDFA